MQAAEAIDATQTEAVPAPAADHARAKLVGNPSGPVVAVRAAELEWFFCWGQSVFERSTFGALLERQSLYGQEPVPCPDCGGDGFSVSGDGTKLDDTCRACRGCGIARTRRVGKGSKGVLLATERCGPCHGRGGRTDCARCHGKGYTEHQPVAVRGQQHEAAHYVPDDSALTRYAVVSRWLLALDARSPAAVEVLELYYGLDGLRWGRVEAFGRVYSLGHLTRSGRKLLDGRDNPQQLPLSQLYENVALSPATKKLERGARLLREIQREGQALHDAAAQLWAQAVASVATRKRAV